MASAAAWDTMSSDAIHQEDAILPQGQAPLRDADARRLSGPDVVRARAAVIGAGPAGLMAAETGDNASIPGGIIPAVGGASPAAAAAGGPPTGHAFVAADAGGPLSSASENGST